MGSCEGVISAWISLADGLVSQLIFGHPECQIKTADQDGLCSTSELGLDHAELEHMLRSRWKGGLLRVRAAWQAHPGATSTN